MTSLLRPGRILCVVLAGLAFALPATSASAAKSAVPCWKTLLNDWYDGTINNLYPIPCYHQALAHLPTDIKVYSSAADDIQRALEQAIAAQKAHPVTTIETNAVSIPGRTTTTGPTGVTTTTAHKGRGGGFSGFVKGITPGGPDAFPLPLLILGFLAVLLVLTGLGGLVWRRYQGRRGTP